MDHKHLAFICLLFLALFVHSKPQNYTKQIDAIFAHLDKPTSPGCSVGIIENGHLLYTRGYGSSNLNYEIPIRPSTSFALGSVSKQFTAMGIAILQEEGKLNVNDDIRKYLPEMPYYGHKITISHLIHHTSGKFLFCSTYQIRNSRLANSCSFIWIWRIFHFQKILSSRTTFSSKGIKFYSWFQGFVFKFKLFSSWPNYRKNY